MASSWPPKKNTAFTLYFTLYKNDGTVIANPGTYTKKYSIDGAAIGDLSASVTEEDTTYGQLSIVISAAEMNGDAIWVQIKDDTAGCVPHTCVFYTTANTQDEIGTSVASILADTGTDGVVLAADAITAAKIADNAIAAEHLADNAIDLATFAADCKTGSALKANVETITNGAITAAAIADSAIDNATFAADVGSTAYATNIIALAADKAIGNAALATATNLADLHTDVGTVITNVGDVHATDLPAVKAETAAIFAAVVTNAAGTDVAADIIALKAVADTIQADTDLLDDVAGGLADIHTDVGTAITGIADVPTNAELATALGTADDAVLAAVAAVKAETAAIVADTNELQTDWANGGRLDLILDAASAPTAAAVADAVWDEALAGHAGAGSTGAALAAAGSAGDPWSTLIPGAYGAGTAGKILGDNVNAPIGTVDTVVDAIKAKTDTIGAGTITAVSPVAASGDISIIAGDSYATADGRSLSWTGTTWPNLTGATVVLKLAGVSYACTVTGAGTASQTVVCELTQTQTALLASLVHSFDVEATLVTSANVVTLVRGSATVASAGA